MLEDYKKSFLGKTSHDNNHEILEKILGLNLKRYTLRMMGKKDISSKWYEDFQYEQDISNKIDDKLLCLSSNRCETEKKKRKDLSAH